jgi:hypothetical protein
MKDFMMDERNKLDKAINDALIARNDWYVAHVDDLADFKIGDKIYATVPANDYKDQLAGVVNRVYVKVEDNGRPRICYQFTRDARYHYSDNTEDHWNRYYGADTWKRDQTAKMLALQYDISQA